MSKEFFISKTGAAIRAKQLRDHLNELPDGRYLVTVQSTTKRTLPQNSWFHAILPDIMKGLRGVGYNDIRSLDDAKDFVKSIFFTKEVTNGTEIVKVIQGTSETSKINFTEKAEDIIIWANEYLGLDIAPPEKQLAFNQM